MLRRLLLTFTLALLFGLGQQGAATHAISHLADYQQDQQQDKSSHIPCDKCVVYASLASAVASPIFALPPATHIHTASPNQTQRAESATHLPYSARAPPALA